MLTSQTSGAQVKSFLLPVNGERNWLNVGQPAAVSTSLRVTYVVTVLNCFAAEIAFSSQFLNPFVIR